MRRPGKAALALSFVLATSGCLLLPPVAAREPVEVVRDKAPVEVTHHKEGAVQFVAGTITITQPPERVWSVLANPFEFEQSISPRFRTTKVLIDRPDVSVMNCSVDTGPFPSINYTVESHYDRAKKISFQSTGGDLKDFSGYWKIEP